MTEVIQKLVFEGYVYVLIYLFLFLVLIAEMTSDLKKYRSVYLFFTLFFLALFTGSRWDTGTDWLPYKQLFSSFEFNWNYILLNAYSFDIGYIFLNGVVKLFSDNYTVFLLIDSFIAIGLVYKFLKKVSPCPSISVYIFYCAFFIAQFMGSNRRMIAMGAILFSFYYMYEQKKKKVIIYQIIAFLFHRSTLFTFFAWFIPRKLFSIKKTISILLVSAIIGLPQLPFKLIGIIGDKLATFSDNPIVSRMLFYSDTENVQFATDRDLILMMLFSIIKRSVFLIYYFWVTQKRKGTLDPLTDFFFNIYIVGFSMYLLLNGSQVFQIMSAYFTFIEIALIGRFWLYTNAKNKLVFLSVLFVYGFFQIYSAVGTFPELYLPYRSFVQ